MMAEWVVRRLDRRPDLRPKLLLIAAALAAAVTHGALGQAGAAAPQTGHAATHPPAFAVSSIKPYAANDMMIHTMMSADGVSMTGMPMHVIVREALGVTNDRLFGEPEWVNTERYSFEAKVAPEDAPGLKGMTPQQRWEMVLPVLEERCALKFHHETRELTVYTLVVARGGLKMQAPAPADASGKQPQAWNTMSGSDQGFTLTGRGASMASITRTVSMQLGSTVVDRTGLTGTYDFTLHFAADEAVRAATMLPGGQPTAEAAGPEESEPTIFTALQEQLGLKLEARKEPVDVIVIDHIEKPSDN
jgi:uncharacterized protein (TIGR03435 family)